jgi:hypothetical protein
MTLIDVLPVSNIRGGLAVFSIYLAAPSQLLKLEMGTTVQVINLFKDCGLIVDHPHHIVVICC